MGNVNTDTLNSPLVVGGTFTVKSGQTMAQDAARSAALAPKTLLKYNRAASTWAPLTSVTYTSASLQCGANGAAIAVWEAVTDGAFKITVDGVALELDGLDFSDVSSLDGVAAIIQGASGGALKCHYNVDTDTFKFESPKKGAQVSSITVLSAPTAGTDIAASTHLDGKTGAGGGVVTAATGDMPAGIYLGPSITAAALVADDVETDVAVIIHGDECIFPEDDLVLENSLTLNDAVGDTGKTIEQVLADMGILIQDTASWQGYENT